jgi:1-acyl-sn-glycerol-3-phosphate acyltransferase
LKLFDFFESRKIILWLFLAATTALLVTAFSRISFIEDISSFMPDNADNKRIKEVYQKFGAANSIIVTFSQLDTTTGIDRNLLTDAAVRFAEILQGRDSLKRIKELTYEVDEETVSEVAGFISQNLPYFLEENDYAKIDSLILPQHIENQLKVDKEILMSPMGGFVREVILNDPLHFSDNTLHNLESFKQNDKFNVDNGFIFNRQGECIVIVNSNYPISETANNKLLANDIYYAVNQTVEDFSKEVKITPFGAVLVSITNAGQLKKDSIFAASIAFVLIFTFLLYFFKSGKSLFCIALSIAFGALFSLGIIAFIKPAVSIIAIGTASIIFGIAINYPLHFLAHFRHNSNIRQTIKEIVNPLLIGNITTVGAFLSLLFISSPAMHDLGMFSALLLVGTIVFVLVFLPHLLSCRRDGIDTPSPENKEKRHVRYNVQTQFGRLFEFSPEKNKLIVFIFLVFTSALLYFSFGTKFETNLQSINYMTDEQRAEMNKLADENQKKGKTLYVVAEGRTTEEALQKYEKISYLKGDFVVNGISNFFPSKELQQKKNERWNEFWKDKKDIFINNFIQISEKQGFKEGSFAGFLEMINKDFQVQEFDFFEPIYKKMGANYFSIDKDKTLIYTVLRGDMIPPVSESDPDIFTFDDSSIATKMLDTLSSDFSNVLFICAFIVFTFLFFSFGRIEITVLAFIPMAVAWVWILGLMNIFGLKFNIVNIILATFIFGQGDDYTIFITEGLIYEYTYRKKMLASFKKSILLSAIILFTAIGMLIFAKHPAMRSLAELTMVGMISVVACAYLFPPLIFRFLTTKKGKPREVPWTLKRFLMMTYAMVIFLFGSLLLTVYGFFLFGFRKNKSGKNCLRYHKMMQRAARFAIQRIPDIKFCYENQSGEMFDKPAVIISNHQSHLDLMCLIMLTPKLIILTNDWVWRNPFYGNIIRYADYYPVSQGIENCVATLADAVSRGYSIVVFPEGTRSADCKIGRFHRGAFYLAEQLELDIVPVFLHGVGHVLPKNDFLLREGQITVQVRERIKFDGNTDYALRTKQLRKYYTETFAAICDAIETEAYFKRFVQYNYIYKGVEVWRKAMAEMRLTAFVQRIDENTVLIRNSGYGVFAFMYALSHRTMQIIAIDDDEDKLTIARSCAGLPRNIQFYTNTEWTNTLS